MPDGPTPPGDPKVHYLHYLVSGQPQVYLTLDAAEAEWMQAHYLSLRYPCAVGTISRAALDSLARRQRLGRANPQQRLGTGQVVPTQLLLERYAAALEPDDWHAHRKMR